MAPRISVRTLGRVRIEVGRRTIGPSAGQLLALLLYLTSRRGQATSRRELQELFFPGAEEHQAGHSLRQLLYRLRQLSVPFAADADGVEIAEQDVWVDWVDLLERGELGTPDLEMVAQGLFPGYSPDISEGYREWFESERGAVRLRLSRAVGLQLTQLRGAGRWDLVDVASRALLALDPLCEDGMIARAQALFASGSKTAALKVIDDYLAELGDDQPNLRLTPAALRRRISERLPEMGHRAHDDRIFVGREDAMQMLSAAGAAARAGAQQTVLVWGEPGIGKTRLLAEYKALACLQGALVFQATCQPHDVFRPLGILSDLVGQLLQAPGALGCDPGAREFLTRLVTTSGKGDHSREPRGESPFAAIISSLDDLLDAISSEYPLLILVDDAHWLDRGSLKAFLGILSSRVARRAWVIFGSRDRSILTNEEGLADRVVSLRLNPLDDAAAMELARRLLTAKKNSALKELEDEIIREGRGNPFFIRLLCRHVATSDDNTSLGQTVAEVLKLRLEQLSYGASRTLEAAVVLGKNCTFTRLARILEFTRLELLRAVEELDDRGLIEVADGCSIRSHALLAKAVAKRMSTSVKRALHSTAAELLQEEFEPSEGGSLPWDCAEHWRLADDHVKAVAVLRSCAARSLSAGRPNDALATYKRALALNTPDEVRYQLVQDALKSAGPGIDWREAQHLMPELKGLRLRMGLPVDAHDEFEVSEFAAVLHGGGDPRPNIPRLRACVQSAEASSRHRLAAGRQLLMTAELVLDKESAELAFLATRQLESGTPYQVLCDLLYHICFGNTQAAKDLADELVYLSTRTETEHLSCLLNAGYAQYRLGSDEAEQTLFKGLELARKTGSRTGEMHAYLFLSTYCWSYRRNGDCKSWLKRFTDLLSPTNDFDATWEYEITSARVAIWEGRLDDAARCIEKARSWHQSVLPLPALLIGTCEIELALKQGREPCTGAELSHLLALYERARDVGRQDEPTCAIVSALQFHKRFDEADALLREYLTLHRRDGFPIHPCLLELAARSTGNAMMINTA